VPAPTAVVVVAATDADAQAEDGGAGVIVIEKQRLAKPRTGRGHWDQGLKTALHDPRGGMGRGAAVIEAGLALGLCHLAYRALQHSACGRWERAAGVTVPPHPGS
jgi:hypothetical protein